MRDSSSPFAGSTRRAGASRDLRGSRLVTLLLTFATALLFAPTASADLGIRGHYQYPPRADLNNPVDKPGEFDGFGAVAVNENGTGGADANDLYIADMGGMLGSVGPADSRVQQFSVSGEFKRLWGMDVVTEGPGNSPEVQALGVTATGGTFTLTFDGDTTSPIAHNTSAATVEGALNALPSTGGQVSVTGGPGDATGSRPYFLSFGGSLKGKDQPETIVDDALLTGPGATAYLFTTIPGGTGHEICEQELGDVCAAGDEGEWFSPVRPAAVFGPGLDGFIGEIEVDQGTGDVYVRNTRHGVNHYSSEGEFLNAFGYDVVLDGPNDGNVDEIHKLVVTATGGTYRLAMNMFPFGLGNNNETPPIPYNASPAQIEAAIAGQENIGMLGGAATVTGGPSGPSDPGPYVYEITYSGSFAGDDILGVNGVTTGLVGSPKSAVITVIQNGGASETCTPSDICKFASFAGSSSENSGDGFARNGRSLGIVPPGAPNVGNILLADSPSGAKVHEYTPDGDLIRVFGWDVVASGPDDSGSNEQQRVTVKATGGKFSLSLKGQRTGALGTGNLEEGSTAVKKPLATSGQFAEGELISGTGIPAGTTITAVGGETMTLSNAATATGNSVSLTANDIPFNASAAEVESALNSLSTIGGAGGSVSVSGGPGDATGSTPYDITFGGTLGGDDIEQMTSTKALEGVETAAVVSTVAGGGEAFEVCIKASGDVCKRGKRGNGVGQFASEETQPTVTADSTGAIYVLEAEGTRRVQKFTPQVAPPGLVPSVFGTVGAPNGSSEADRPGSMAIGAGNEVFVLKRYPEGTAVCPDGSPSPAEFRVQKLSSDGLTLLDTSRPCATDPSLSKIFVSPVVQSGAMTFNLSSGDAYVSQFGSRRVLLFGPTGPDPEVALSPVTGISSSKATISGTIDPNGPGPVIAPVPATTKYRVEFRKVGAPAWEQFSPDTSTGSGFEPTPFSVGLSGLTPKTEYEARVVVVKPFGYPTAIETTAPFTTLGAPPRIDALWARNVTADSADLHGVINPLGTATSYHFEYGKTPAYGNSTPEVEIGAGGAPVPVDAHIEALESVVYHFRLVATNAEGGTVSINQTFNFYPEPCPNETVRQQTGSGGLPDCRAYELVSPEAMGSVSLFPAGVTSPHASNPARVGYTGGLGTIPGPWNPPNAFGDDYVATRTHTGWETRYVGFQAHETMWAEGSPSGRALKLTPSRSLERFISWGPPSIPPPEVDIFARSNAPYVFDPLGNKLGRLPTNLEEVPGGDRKVGEGGFTGAHRPSPDFSHYFFSSNNVAFAPGGLTTGAGSAYDNDIGADTVTIASKTPAGDDIPVAPGKYNDGHYLQLPAASIDGSHILIEAPAACKFGSSPQFQCPDWPAQLYLRVGGAVTYEVSRGHLVKLEGMTADGSLVYFTSNEQVTADDQDTSTDLFRWRESDDTVTRVTEGPGVAGDSDNCTATWIEKCSVEVIPIKDDSFFFESANQFDLDATDNAIGEQSGDIYFYSPEQFGTDGIPGRRNLYVFRNGQAQYVTTLDADKPASRFQVSANGRFAAFVTPMRLTAYDNAGYEMMYRFDANTGEVRCVSCHPEGLPPTGDVEASENGIFMTNDGRSFFTTRDALVQSDTNAGTDLYEYVSGRAQLITTGVGIAPEEGDVELIGVSADGTDVYFMTTETLVSQDRNGPFPKVYDARTGGGFPLPPPPLPCAAADECHEGSPSTLVTPSFTTTANVGSGGNARPRARARCKVKRGQRRKKRARPQTKRRAGKRASKCRNTRRGK